MAKLKKQEEQELKAYFLPRDFAIDALPNEPLDSLKNWIVEFKADKYSALFHLGFSKKQEWFSPSIDYLHHITEILIKKLSQESEIEINRERVEVFLLEDEIYQLKEELPFVIGMEYVDDEWILKIWDELLSVFKLEIKNYDGSVARYFAEYNANINVVGRVFFHLVENNEDKYPFAFMATYSTKTVKSKKAVHTPLKNALKEFSGDEKKLLSLISTVIRAAEKSSFISE